MASIDKLGLEAIKSLHQKLDDDANGNVDLSESNDVSCWLFFLLLVGEQILEAFDKGALYEKTKLLFVFWSCPCTWLTIAFLCTEWMKLKLYIYVFSYQM